MSSGETAPGRGGRAERVFVGVAFGLFVWQLAWIWISWPYMLDDALIHLRYADNLLRYHRITYDGVHASFGTSSLLYVSLLAGLRAAWGSPVLPRVVSSVVYPVLVAALFSTLYRGLRGRRDLPVAVWMMALGVLAVTVAPSAVRWLDDGMETGLVFLDALLGLLLLRRMLGSRQGGVLLGAAAFAYGLLTVLLRVELLSLVGCIALMAVLEIGGRRAGGRRAGWMAVIPLLAGALAALVLIWTTMGALLPDTAYAKGFGGREWMSTFETTGKTLLGSTTFGIGSVGIWLAGWWGVWKGRGMRGADWVANLLFPVLLLVSAVRGQQIFFIRYFGWAVFFALLWDVLRCADVTASGERGFPVAFRPVMAAILVSLAAAFGMESPAFAKVFALRNASFLEMQGQDLGRLRGQLGIAEDVGFAGYFTGADLCDPYGLVNGTAAAHSSYGARFARCMALHPAFGFGSREFLRKMAGVQSLAGWRVCGTYNFRNVRSDDVHYLVVAPSLGGAVCVGRGTPVAEAVPGLP